MTTAYRELLGLPAAGKSWQVRAGRFADDGFAAVCVGDAPRAERAANMLRGALRWRGAIRVFRQVMTDPSATCPRPKLLKSFLRLCERIGRAAKSERVVVDEGVAQASWGLMCRSDAARASAEVAALVVRVHANVVYLRCPKAVREQRYRERDRKVDVPTARGRAVMAQLLRDLRRIGRVRSVSSR